jgi:hypothetical protein
MTNRDGIRDGDVELDGPAHDHGHEVGTPIYDELYADYRGAFRALPGDRFGEEELRFQPFDHLELSEGRMFDDHADGSERRAA